MIEIRQNFTLLRTVVQRKQVRYSDDIKLVTREVNLDFNSASNYRWGANA
jgi:hypothetical protein